MKELKHNSEWYRVREGSPVEVQWAVQLVGEDLWWERFVELCPWCEWLYNDSFIGCNLIRFWVHFLMQSKSIHYSVTYMMLSEVCTHCCTWHRSPLAVLFRLIIELILCKLFGTRSDRVHWAHRTHLSVIFLKLKLKNKSKRKSHCASVVSVYTCCVTLT